MTLPRLTDWATRVKPAPRGRPVRAVRGSMNQVEARYAKHLQAQVARGELAGFWFEPLKFRLADKTYYSPDFLVMLPDGRLELHEVKGWMEDDAAVKLKVTAETYWLFPVVVATEKRGAWTLREVGR